MTDFFYDTWKLLLGAFVLGLAWGAVYDVFRIIRISRSNPPAPSGGFYEKIAPRRKIEPFGGRLKKARGAADAALTFIEDILFFLICAAAEVIFFLAENDGAVRIYCILFTACGYFIYRITLGRAVIFFSSNIIFLFKCLIYWLFYIIMIPIKHFLSLMRKCGSFMYSISVKKLLRAIKKRRSNSLEKSLYDDAGNGFGIFKETGNVEEG